MRVKWRLTPVSQRNYGPDVAEFRPRFWPIDHRQRSCGRRGRGDLDRQARRNGLEEVFNVMNKITRRVAVSLVMISALMSGALCQLACTSEAVWDEFREASTSAFSTGFKSIADGLIDGLFAVFEPDSSSASDSASGN